MSLGHAFNFGAIAMIRWTVKSAGVVIPGPVSDREIGQAKNILRGDDGEFDSEKVQIVFGNLCDVIQSGICAT